MSDKTVCEHCQKEKVDVWPCFGGHICQDCSGEISGEDNEHP